MLRYIHEVPERKDLYYAVIAEVRLRHASNLVPFETEPNRDLKEGESAREDPWYEQPRITKLPTIHSECTD